MGWRAVCLPGGTIVPGLGPNPDILRRATAQFGAGGGIAGREGSTIIGANNFKCFSAGNAEATSADQFVVVMR
jgi:hypothetical protein